MFICFPILWTLFTGFKNEVDAISVPPKFFVPLSFSKYIEAFSGDYPDMQEVRNRLRNTAIPYMRKLNDMTDELGTRWSQKPRMPIHSSQSSFIDSYPGFNAG